MDAQTDCDAIRELIPDYAFGLTDPSQNRLIETTLAECPDAAHDLADFRNLQNEMRSSVSQQEPATDLGERIMAMAGAATPAAPTTLPIAAPINPPALVRRPVRWAWLVAAVTVIALVGTNFYWLARVNDLSQQQKALIAAINGQHDTAFVATNASDIRWVRLPPSQENIDASAFLMWNAESETGLLYVHGLPKVASGKTYQFWLTRGQDFVHAGTLRIDDDGKGILLFHIKEPIDKYTWARITAEPDNSNSPTGTPVVNGKLSA
ncbi:MAG: anti-sigma factor [Chloroflexota bacterium]